MIFSIQIRSKVQSILNIIASTISPAIKNCSLIKVSWVICDRLRCFGKCKQRINPYHFRKLFFPECRVNGTDSYSIVHHLNWVFDIIFFASKHKTRFIRRIFGEDLARTGFFEMRPGCLSNLLRLQFHIDENLLQLFQGPFQFLIFFDEGGLLFLCLFEFLLLLL